jgi:hypothetical protein
MHIGKMYVLVKVDFTTEERRIDINFRMLQFHIEEVGRQGYYRTKNAHAEFSLKRNRIKSVLN